MLVTDNGVGMKIHELLISNQGLIVLRDCRSMKRKILSASEHGQLEKIFPGIYLASSIADDPKHLARAASVWDPNSVLTSTWAAQLTYWPETPAKNFHLYSQKNNIAKSKLKVSRRRIPESLMMDLGGIRASCAEATVLMTWQEGFEGYLCDGLRKGIVSADTLARANKLLRSGPGQLGSESRKKCLEAAKNIPWSIPELNLHRILNLNRVRGWQGNVPIRIDGKLYYADILFKELKVVIEVDGYGFHSSRKAFDEDRIRHNALTAAGYMVLHFAASMITENPRYVLKEILRTLELAKLVGQN